MGRRSWTRNFGAAPSINPSPPPVRPPRSGTAGHRSAQPWHTACGHTEEVVTWLQTRAATRPDSQFEPHTHELKAGFTG